MLDRFGYVGILYACQVRSLPGVSVPSHIGTSIDLCACLLESLPGVSVLVKLGSAIISLSAGQVKILLGVSIWSH